MIDGESGKCTRDLKYCINKPMSDWSTIAAVCIEKKLPCIDTLSLFGIAISANKTFGILHLFTSILFLSRNRGQFFLTQHYIAAMFFPNTTIWHTTTLYIYNILDHWNYDSFPWNNIVLTLQAAHCPEQRTTEACDTGQWAGVVPAVCSIGKKHPQWRTGHGCMLLSSTPLSE